MKYKIIREVQAVYGKGQRLFNYKMDSPGNVQKFFIEKIGDKTQEHVMVAILDNKNHVIAYSVAGIGTASECFMNPREIFITAISLNASSVIVAHNHPSGELHASREDLESTKSLIYAGAIVGIKILDHVIVTMNEMYSLRENSDLFNETTGKMLRKFLND